MRLGGRIVTSLFGIAVDPDFVLNRQVYLYYTESSTGVDTSAWYVVVS